MAQAGDLKTFVTCLFIAVIKQSGQLREGFLWGLKVKTPLPSQHGGWWQAGR